MSFKFNPLTGQLDLVGSSVAGSAQTVEQRTITNAEALAKQLTLANTPTSTGEVVLDIISGVSQINGTDFSVTGTVLSWNGLGLDVTLSEGDNLRIIYT